MRTAKEIFVDVLNKMKLIEPTKVLTAFELIKDADEAFVVSEMNRIKKEMRDKCTRFFFIWSGWDFSVGLFKDEWSWDNIFEDLERELEDTQGFDDEGNIIVLNREEAENQLEKDFRVFMLLYSDYHVFNQRLEELQVEGKRLERIRAKTNLGISWQAVDEIYKILTTERYQYGFSPLINCDKQTWDKLCNGEPNNSTNKIELTDAYGAKQRIMEILNLIGYDYNNIMKQKMAEYFGEVKVNPSDARIKSTDTDLLIRLRNIVEKYRK